MNLIFKPESFDPDLSFRCRENVAASAQMIFDNWLKENGKVAFGNMGTNDQPRDLSRGQGEHDTYKFIIFAEPIKKECVKHEPEKIIESRDSDGDLVGDKKYICKCGVELVAEWKAK